MVTNRDDDYLICKHYYSHIDDVSSEHKDFITFEHRENHYFAWVNEGKVILRSEAYPSAEKMERGIKAIIKNRDIHERYSIDSQHGVHFLLLWGGGNHQKHTGNFEKHNEIGRSCPTKTKEELYAMMGFRGKDFVNGVFGLSSGSQTSSAGKGAAIAAATANAASLAASSGGSKKSSGSAKAAASTTAYASTGSTATKAAASSSGGFKWWWLLPLLLIPAFFMWKGCGADAGTKTNAAAKTEMSAKAKADKAAATLAATNKAKADAAAKAEADAAAKLAADNAAIEKTAAAKKAKATGGSGNSRNSSSGGRAYRGNKNSGF